MQLDVRIPMGWLFLSLGIILSIYGFVADHAIYVKHSLGQNVNLLWGGIFVAFGVVVLLIARNSKKS